MPQNDTDQLPHPYIVIEGNIGAGKTTLCQRLTRQFDCRLILEQFADNPFLPFFYENPERYAFPVELFFMTERHKQLQQDLSQQSLFQQTILADYYFVKTLLFARSNLNPEEFRLFQRLFKILNANLPKPDLLVYIHRPVDILLKNIQHRGRSYEQNMDPDYLLRIQNAYFDYFKTLDGIPIVIIDAGDMNFLQNDAHYQLFLETIHKKYRPGVHQVKFSWADNSA